MRDYKIIITGTMGAGKTTAIGTVSEIKPVVTDVLNTDPSINKEKTTVGFDYGEITINEHERLRLYGTPGQDRFDFMWKVLGQGALGVVILIDHTSSNPMADLQVYISSFKELIENTACVVGISQVNEDSPYSIDGFAEYLQNNGIICPVVPVDVREKSQVLWILDLLLTQLEMRS